MIIKNNLCNVSVMPIFEGKRLEFVGVKFSETEKKAFEDIAKSEDRGVSYIVRELALRGLAYYLADKNLKATKDEVEAARQIIFADPHLLNGSFTQLPEGFGVIGYDGQTDEDIKKISDRIKKKKNENESDKDKEKPDSEKQM